MDDEDADLADLKWTSVIGSKTRIYPCRQKRVGPRKEGRRLFLYMHRVIAERMGLEGAHIDHIDGNTLNNRRSNLRAVTPVENARNVVGARANSKSGALGVFPHKNGGWVASIRVPDSRHYLGWFACLEDAVAARLDAEKRLWGVQPRRMGAHDQ